MIRTLFAASLLVITSGPVFAKDAVEDIATSAEAEVAAGVLAKPVSLVRAAALDAKAHSENWRFAYSLHLRSQNGDDEPIEFKARFDPRRSDRERWSAFNEDALSKEARKAFRQLAKSDTSDDVLLYDGAIDLIENASLKNETAEAYVFSGPVREDGLPEDAVVGTVTYDRKKNIITQIDVASIRPFKPMPVAKLEEMSQTQRYEEISEGGPALLRESENRARGKAMFRSFDSTTNLVYSDFEMIPASEIMTDAEVADERGDD